MPLPDHRSFAWVEGNGGPTEVKGLESGMSRPPRDLDLADRSRRLQLLVSLAVPLAILALALGFLLVGPVLLLLLFPLLGVGAAFVLREIIWHFMERAGRLVVGTLHGIGSVGYEATFSAEESLVARGRYEEAAAAYRAHLSGQRLDVSALLRLADLLERHLGDAAEAERLYFEVRRITPAPDRVGNRLIDLYRRTGNRGRLMAELARFASAHAGRTSGTAARKELQSMKESDRHPPA